MCAVVRNKPAYTKQGLIEIGILEHLNKADSDDKHHVVRMLDYFCVKGEQAQKQDAFFFCPDLVCDKDTFASCSSCCR